MDGWMGRDRWWNGIVRQLGAKLPALTRSLAHWRHRRASPLRRAKRSNVNVVAVSASVGRRSSGFWYLHQLILFDEEVASIPRFPWRVTFCGPADKMKPAKNVMFVISLFCAVELEFHSYAATTAA